MVVGSGPSPQQPAALLLPTPPYTQHPCAYYVITGSLIIYRSFTHIRVYWYLATRRLHPFVRAAVLLKGSGKGKRGGVTIEGLELSSEQACRVPMPAYHNV